MAGLSRFGDRKDDLQFLAGVSPQGPSLERIAIAGGMIWPPSPTAPAVAPARVVERVCRSPFVASRRHFP